MNDLLELFPYQITGASWLASKTQALLADDMGLGKSAQAVRACDLIGAKRILVVCPAAVRVNWAREFQRFSPMDRPCKVLTGKTDTPPPSGVAVCSYEYATSHPELKRPWDVLILDEAHYLKERSARRTKAIYGANKKIPGLDALASRVWRLTGTPAPNNASELYTHLKSCGIVTDPYWDFAFRYCSGFDSTFGYKITGHKNTEELKRLMAPVLLRRMKEDVLKDLPPIYFQEVTVEPGAVDMTAFGEPKEVAEQIRVAELTLQEALAQVDGDLGRASSSINPEDVALATLRKFVALAKTPAVCAQLWEELETGQLDKVVIFAHHKAVVAKLEKELKPFGAVSVHGGTSPKARQEHIDAFQTDPDCRVFIGNIQAAGTGLTLTSSCEVAFVEQSWVPAENAQAAMRCHRIGQTRPVRVRVFALAGSVDEQVQSSLVRKVKELAKIF